MKWLGIEKIDMLLARPRQRASACESTASKLAVSTSCSWLVEGWTLVKERASVHQREIDVNVLFAIRKH